MGSVAFMLGSFMVLKCPYRYHCLHLDLLFISLKFHSGVLIEVHESQKANSLLRAADNWLWLLQVKSSRFQVFSFPTIHTELSQVLKHNKTHHLNTEENPSTSADKDTSKLLYRH